MKKKSVTAIVLVALMTAMTVLPVFARDVAEDTNITGWNEETIDCKDDVTLTVDEGGSATVGQINGEDHDVTINGGGTLNVDSSSSDSYRAAINGSNVTIENVTVNATGSDSNQYSAGIQAFSSTDESKGNLTINNATVNASGKGYGLSASGSVSITNSDVEAKGTNGGESEGILGDGGVTITNSSVKASGGTAIMSQNITLSGCSVVEGSFAGTSVTIAKNADDKPCESEKEEKKKSSSDEETAANATQTWTIAPVSIVSATVDPVAMGENAYTSKITSMIASAPYGGIVELNVTSAAYLNDLIVSALETRSDVSLKINVAVNGVPYVLNIPAGFNLRALLGADGKIDIQKLLTAFGTAK